MEELIFAFPRKLPQPYNAIFVFRPCSWLLLVESATIPLMVLSVVLPSSPCVLFNLVIYRMNTECLKQIRLNGYVPQSHQHMHKVKNENKTKEIGMPNINGIQTLSLISFYAGSTIPLFNATFPNDFSLFPIPLSR